MTVAVHSRPEAAWTRVAAADRQEVRELWRGGMEIEGAEERKEDRNRLTVDSDSDRAVDPDACPTSGGNPAPDVDSCAGAADRLTPRDSCAFTECQNTPGAVGSFCPLRGGEAFCSAECCVRQRLRDARPQPTAAPHTARAKQRVVLPANTWSRTCEFD